MTLVPKTQMNITTFVFVCIEATFLILIIVFL